MHEAQDRAPIHFLRKEMQAKRTGSREVYACCSRRSLDVCEQRTAAQVNVGYNAAVPLEIPFQGKGIDSSRSNGNGSGTGQPRLRDKLCLLIRKYELDPTLVKLYAADFCGTEALRDASRDLVEAFISTLANEAAKDRAALICKLNSYNQLAEVKS